MEMKKSIISQIAGSGTWNTPDGKTLYKFEITTESGDSGMIFKATQDSGLAIGGELEYYLDQKGNIKIPKKPYIPQGGGGTGLSKEEWKKKDQMIIRQSSLKSACCLHSQSSVSVTDVLATAERFVEWVNCSTSSQKNDGNDLPF